MSSRNILLKKIQGFEFALCIDGTAKSPEIENFHKNAIMF